MPNRTMLTLCSRYVQHHCAGWKGKGRKTNDKPGGMPSEGSNPTQFLVLCLLHRKQSQAESDQERRAVVHRREGGRESG